MIKTPPIPPDSCRISCPAYALPVLALAGFSFDSYENFHFALNFHFTSPCYGRFKGHEALRLPCYFQVALELSAKIIFTVIVIGTMSQPPIAFDKPLKKS